MTPELEKLVEDLKAIRIIGYEHVEPLVTPALAMSDDELVEFLKGLEPRAVAKLGAASPVLVSRLNEIVRNQVVPEPDDNRFERTYQED